MRLPVEATVDLYGNRLFRTAYTITKQLEDAEDVVQDVLVQYHVQSTRQFESEDHLKAWLLRVTINKAKNLTRSFWNRSREDLSEEMFSFEEPKDQDLFEAVMALPEKYRITIHLYYYEGYSVKEIGNMLKRPDNTIKSYLNRGRQTLKCLLGEDWKDDE